MLFRIFLIGIFLIGCSNINKSEIRHGTIDSMSKDEVIKALKEIKDSYEPKRVEGVIDHEDTASAKKGKRLLSGDQKSSRKTA